MNGIRVDPLPLSTDELPATLPSGLHIQGSDYLGHSIVSVDTTATPVLFHPGSENAEGAIETKLSRRIHLDTILEALSLERSDYVDKGIVWNDYGELSALETNSEAIWGKLKFPMRTSGWLLSKNLTTGVSTLVWTKVQYRTCPGKRLQNCCKHWSKPTPVPGSQSRDGENR